MNLRRPLTVGLLAGTVSLGVVPLAHATFLDRAPASVNFSAATLEPPTGVSLTRTCVINVLSLVVASAHFEAAWTPSSTQWAQDQVVELRNGSGLLVGGPTVLAKTASTASFDVLTPVGSHTVTVRTRYSSWTSEATRSASAC